ncbi:hypothetical protein ACWD5R_09255 [Streptomyces sp. NPDC002514]|uniref:hypothetical protein n=1 Tax=Streptomyces sp. NPDC001270 TaxID=3364554 RepID=UPI00368EA949
MSAGYALKNRFFRSAGFGLLGAYYAEAAVESLPDRESAATNMAKAFGTAVWAGGMVAENNIAQAVGPAGNALTSIVSAGLRYYKGEEGGGRELVDAAAMAAFAVGGYTGNNYARAMAFGMDAVGFFLDARKDKSYGGHGLGASVWSWGAGAVNNDIQAAGAGVVAGSEFLRLTNVLLDYYQKKDAGQSGPEAAMELPLYERRDSAATVEPAPAASVPMSVSPVAAAVDRVAPATLIPMPPPTFSPYSSAASSPVLAGVSSPLLQADASPTLPAAPISLAPAEYVQLPPAAYSPVSSAPSSPGLTAPSSAVLWADPAPASPVASSPVLPTASSLMQPTAFPSIPLSAPPAIPPTTPQRYAPPIPASTRHAHAGGDDNVFSRPSSAPVRVSVPAATARPASR